MNLTNKFHRILTRHWIFSKNILSFNALRKFSASKASKISSALVSYLFLAHLKTTNIYKMEELDQKVVKGMMTDRVDKLIPQNDPISLEIKNNYIRALTLMIEKGKNYKEAEQCFKKAIELLNKNDATDTLVFAIIIADYALLLVKKDDFQSAYELIQWSIDIKTKILGPVHQEVSNGYQQMADAYRESPYPLKGLPFLEYACKINKKLYSEDSVQYINCLSNLSELYFRSGERTQCNIVAEQAFRIAEKMYGPTDPKTLEKQRLWMKHVR